MLDCVNNYFPDILPESVLKHYGYSSRPEGNIGKSALFSRDVYYAEGVLLFLIKSAYINKKEDETLFKTGNSQKTTPSNASSSIYSLLNKLQNVNNTDTKFSLDVDRFSNDLRIHTMYAKNKGNNDDTANAKALASTSETSVGNVPFNSSISKYSDNVKKFSLDVGRFSND